MVIEKDYEWEIQYKNKQIKELEESLKGTIRENGILNKNLGE